MTRLFAVALALALALPLPAFARGGGGGRSSGGGKTVHVESYTRKDGTTVHAHDRSPPGTAPAKAPSVRSHSSGSSRSYGTTRPGTGHTKRSKAAKDAFMRDHPCPSTGKTHGACPGYVVDHVRALKHGGADDPSNMQWQTTGEAKTKDKWE